MKEAAGEDERELAEEMSKAFMSEELPDEVFGAPKAGAGMWASMIRIISPVKGNTVAKIPFEQNEAAHRLYMCYVCGLQFYNLQLACRSFFFFFFSWFILLCLQSFLTYRPKTFN